MMGFEMIGFLDINTPDGRTKILKATIFQPSIPNPCSTERMSPLDIIRNACYPKTSLLAAKLESTACGPAGEFADHDQCVKMISQPW